MVIIVYSNSFLIPIKMNIDLSKKNILITGASRGIGAGIARALGKSGASVALNYHENWDKAESLALEIGNNSFSIPANLADIMAVSELFEQVIKSMGQIHVVINNAAIAIKSPVGKTDNEWIADFEKTINVNLTASALLCKKAIEHFKEIGGGIIINISSRAAHRGDTGDFMAYAASKGGLSSLTKSIAREFGKDGISAFNIAPGFVKTDMAAQFIEEYGENFLIDDIALNRMTEPADLGPLVVLLASGLAEHATGTTIDVNAGSYVR